MPASVPGVLRVDRGYPYRLALLDFKGPDGTPLNVSEADAQLRLYMGDGPAEFSVPVVTYTSAAPVPSADPLQLQQLSYSASVLDTAKSGFLLFLSSADTAAIEDGWYWAEFSLVWPGVPENDVPVLTARFQFAPSGRAR